VTIRKAIIVSILAAALCNAAAAQSIDELRRNFVSPPDDARIMMRWWWFGPSVTKAEIESELRKMKEGGIGGVEVQPVYPLLPDDAASGIRNLPYLSNEFLEMLRFASQKAKELGMRFDLTLGSGWSFGGAKTPISEAAGQLRVERVKVTANQTRIPVPSLIPAERFLAVFAHPAPPANAGTTDEYPNEPWSELKDIRDEAVWFQPAANDRELIFLISSKSGMQVKRPAFGAEGYVLNHLDRPSVDNYLKNTGDRLFQAFDRSHIPYSVFCDSLEVYNQDWTDDFLSEFAKRRGYDLKRYLPALVGDIGPKTTDIRYDWGRTITELFNERFMVPMQAWSKANGTRFRIQGYGIPPAAISSNKWADISDGEGAQWKVVRAARWASSANHIYGRTVTSSETWTWLHSPVFRATPLDLKAEADIHFLQGINQLIGHGWGYTPPGVEYPGWRFYAAGAYSEQNPWWIVMPDLAKYLQRMSWLMRQGKPQNDVALYLPNADAYAGFSAGRVHLIDAERELVGEKLMPAIFEAGYNLDFFDDTILADAVPTNGVLALGASDHKVVILPKIERMPIESARKLDAFVRSGGKVVAIGRMPSIVPGLQATAKEQAELKSIVERLTSQLSVRLVANEDDIGSALHDLLQPDALITPSAKDFGIVHRRTADADIYFVANTSNQTRKVEIAFRASGEPEIWDAMNGRYAGATVTRSDASRTNVSLTFEPYRSYVVVFTKTSAAPTQFSYTAIAASIDLNSDWLVSFGSTAPVSMSKLRSWSESGSTQNFSGTALYEKSIDIPNEFLRSGKIVALDLGEAVELPVQQLRNGMQTWIDPPVREAAVVYVNGERAGSLWSPPYRLEITSLLRPGKNLLRIVVGNTALNYMAGRKLPDYKLLNLRYGERFQPQDMDKIQVLPSGLTGSVRLLSLK
jgi:hypothetical protein